MAEPVVLLVQFAHVVSSAPAIARPSLDDPVSMSCMLGLSPRPFTTSPFSFSAVCLVRLFAPWSWLTSLAMTTPLAFCHGPRPMRSRALTGPAPVVLR